MFYTGQEVWYVDDAAKKHAAIILDDMHEGAGFDQNFLIDLGRNDIFACSEDDLREKI